ncbi:D-glycero-beta-D-manno-heptose 1,7-bisphosphate 7-phosphatase [Ideonella sp.]|uniref:D-glycero-beta-D-manno-heptose 1,7-bisphosphate 7-phosphatase n=1 Tax=Ideonella sp. TaxID=1929293 RepID=UPI0035B3E472
MSPGAAPRRAAFLDRDGVINRDTGYLHRWEDFEFLPGVLPALQRLQAAGWALVVVTNQSGIARGYYTEADYQALTGHMRQAMADAGAPPLAVYHCPHHPRGQVEALARECDCRKPQPGMLRRAAAEHGLSLADSFMVGDKLADVQAARAAGAGHAYLVRCGQALEPGAAEAADAVFDDLAACVDAVLAVPRHG